MKKQYASWMRAALYTVLVATAMVAGRAQGSLGSISGTITDNTGAAIKGATVVLTNTDRGQDIRTVTTNGSGFYTATSLPLGTYTVKVSDAGFKNEAVTGLVLHVNDALTVNRALVAGNATETVSVVADQVQLNMENGMSQGLIDGTQVRELVLNNRNYEQLILLQPGVSYGGASDQLYIGNSLPAGTSNQVAFSINGSRPTSNNWTVDGADNVDRGANLTLLTYPSVDAIAEFKTLRGVYLAEYGRNASGQVNVVTRSGTSQFHGSAYEFFRNDIFNANRYFNNLNLVQRPRLRYNDFGYTVGGPVWIPKVYDGRKHGTFFFFSQELRRVVNYAAATALLPTDYERVGDFSNAYYRNAAGATQLGPLAVCTAYTQTPTSQTCTAYGTKVTNISPTATAYLKDIYNKLPVPNAALNVAQGFDPHQYVYNQRNVFNNNQQFIRIDQSIGQHINAFYRYLHDSLPSQEAGGLFNSANAMPGVPNTNTLSPGTQHLGHVTYVATPKLLFDVAYAFSYGAIISRPVGLETQANSPDIKPNLPFPGLLGVIPSLATSGLTSVASAGNYDDYNRNHNAFGDVTYTLGVHTFKAGATFNHYQKTENATGNGSPYPQGIFTFSGSAATAQPTAAQLPVGLIIPGTTGPGLASASFANFLLGNVNGGFTQGSTAITPNIQQNSIEVYVQDDWKIRPRLTLNLGVRYSYFGQPTDANGRMSNFDPSTFVRANAQTVTSTGVICKAPATSCANSNGLNSGVPNGGADPINGIILGTPGNNGHASSYGSNVGSTPKGNFAPRLGFAYDLFGDGKTAFRGGFGIAYDSSQVSIYETPIFGNLPYVSVPNLPVATLDNPAGGTASVSTAIPSLSGSPLNYQSPYTMQYSLDIQQQLSPTFVLDIGYFGSQGRHLQGKVDINSLRPGAFAAAGIQSYGPSAACATGFISETCEQQLNQIRPYVGYKAVSVVRTIFSSNYNGLQVKARKQFAGKSYFDANYTWSRALTNSQADYSGGPQNVYNINADYGRAIYDRTNILTFDGVYELPFYKDQKGLVGHIVGGWELSGLYTINSGLPLTVTMSGGSTICYTCVTSGVNAGATQTSVYGLANGGLANDSAGLGILGPSVAGLRPNMVADPNKGYGAPIHTRLNWFYRPAFVSPSPSDVAVGNEKRGVVEGPGFNRLDVGIFRNFKIWENVVFQLRGEAFNVANHTNWATVGVASTTASTFGQVTDTRDPRILQVAGKITF